jgi:hypothetical protein
MAHGRLAFLMPAPSAQAFEAFFNHAVRLKWDTLLKVNYVEGGGTHPYVGAISTNKGRGWKTGLMMRTRFLSYDPPRQASAEMIESNGPFGLWAASMRFRDRDDGTCELVYTYSIKLRPAWLGRLLDPLAGKLFARETRLRFAAMAEYLRIAAGPNREERP